MSSSLTTRETKNQLVNIKWLGIVPHTAPSSEFWHIVYKTEGQIKMAIDLQTETGVSFVCGLHYTYDSYTDGLTAK